MGSWAVRARTFTSSQSDEFRDELVTSSTHRSTSGYCLLVFVWAASIFPWQAHAQQEGWFPQSSGTSADLSSITLADENTAMACGTGGTILVTTNGGVNWLPQLPVTTEWLEAIAMSDRFHATAVGTLGTIVRTINGGEQWTVQASGTSSVLRGVAFANADDGFVVGMGGVILHTTNGGTNWISHAAGTIDDLSGVAMISADTAIVVGRRGLILKTANAGATWHVINAEVNKDLYAITFANNEAGLIVGDGGIVLHTTDAGDSWRADSIPGCEYLSSVCLSAGGRAHATGYEGIYFSTDNGSHWTLQNPASTPGAIRSIGRSGEFVVLASGDGGLVYRTNSSGIYGWNPMQSGTTQLLLSVRMLDPLNAVAVGDSGLVILTTDGGESWLRRDVPIVRRLFSIASVGDETWFVCGDSGLVMQTTNAGISWQQSTSGTTQSLRGLRFLSASHGYAVGAGGTILRTTNAGFTWSPLTSGTTSTINGISFFDEMNGIYVAGSGIGAGVVRWTSDGGSTWNLPTSGTFLGMFGVETVGDSTAVAVGIGNSIRRTSNRGRAWDTVSTLSTHYFGVSFPDTRTGFVVGSVSRVFRTTDEGLSWQPQTLRVSVSLRSVSFATPQDGVAVGDYGTIIVTHMGGIFTNVGGPNKSAPQQFQLFQNYPNPFNPKTTIRFAITKASDVSLTVFDIIGREVAELVHDRRMPGEYSIPFDGLTLSSGVYFCRLQTGDRSSILKMVLMK
jgi:photosystem II stability/assembly factor-like uncharacterized protein